MAAAVDTAPGARGQENISDDSLTWVDVTVGTQLIKVLNWDEGRQGIITLSGQRLWPSAKLLALLMHHNPDILEGAKNVIELGAGLGVVGIAAAKMAGHAKVMITDGEDSVVELCREHLRRNFEKDQPQCEKLFWGEGLEEFKQKHGTFDLILGSDVVEGEDSLPPFLSTVKELLNSSPTAMCLQTYVERPYLPSNLIAREAEACGLSYTYIEWENQPWAHQMVQTKDPSRWDRFSPLWAKIRIIAWMKPLSS
ncbi:protein N-lysine methyltransferase METTL21A-like isoform X2 [Branchiostoma floridae x Branchiostoma japonicum]